MFWYNLDVSSLCGTVAFALFGQKCQECSKEGLDTFTSAMWYQEEVVKVSARPPCPTEHPKMASIPLQVIFNVYNSVGQTYYGFQAPPYVKIRRPGKPRSQHASELCQACQMGVCSASAATKKDAYSHPVNACAIVQANRTQLAIAGSGVA